MSFPGGGGGGENGVFINIGGSSVGLNDALRTANEQLQVTAKSLESAGSAAKASSATMSESMKAWLASMKAATEGMEMNARGMKTLVDMSEVLGVATARNAEAWLQASTSATEYGAKLEYLAAQTRQAAQSQAYLAAGLGGGGGGMLAGLMGDLSGEGVIGLLGELGGAVLGVIDPMIGFVEQAGAMVTGLISFSVLNEVIQEVQGFTDALVQLNIQTEKNQFSWRYLYGGGNTPHGAAVAQGMADWTKSFSMQIPYTRQDLLNSITTLAPMGLSAQGLEHYLPTIADLGATRAPNMDLAQIAQVIMSAGMGYTRMLKYDLKINPEDLIKYGLDASSTGAGVHINDTTTLLPALEKYAKAHGLAGASKDIAHDTFWGAWSSFIDRIQNFELDTGKGLFGSLKDALNGLSSWIDTHQAQIQRFADLLSNTLGNAFKTVTGIVGDFLTGVGQSGLFDFLNVVLPNTPAPSPKKGKPEKEKAAPEQPSKPNVKKKQYQRGETNIDEQVGTPPSNLSGWQQAGQIIGTALKDIAQGWNAVSDAWSPTVTQEVNDLGTAWQNFSNSLTPEDKQMLQDIGGALLSIPWALITGALFWLARGLDLLRWTLEHIVHPMEDFQQHMEDLGAKIRKWFDDLQTNATTWGSDLVKNLASGMLSALPNLNSASADVAGVIASWIHHSTPDTGPLADDDQWMPDMMTMFARDIRNHTPLLASAMSEAAGAMAGAMRPTGGYQPAAGGGAGGGGPVMLVINGSSTLETMKLIDYVLSRRDANVNLATRASSGLGYYQFGTLGAH